MEGTNNEKEALITRTLHNPDYNQNDLGEPLNVVLDELPAELAPLPPMEVLQQLKQEHFLSKEIKQLFNNMKAESIFQTTNPLHLNYIASALNESHQVIIESFAAVSNAKDLEYLKNTKCTSVIAEIKFLFFI